MVQVTRIIQSAIFGFNDENQIAEVRQEFLLHFRRFFPRLDALYRFE